MCCGSSKWNVIDNMESHGESRPAGLLTPLCRGAVQARLASWSRSCPTTTWSWRGTGWRSRGWSARTCGPSSSWWTTPVCCVTENAPQKPGGPLAWFRVKAYLLTVIRPSVQLPKLQWKPPYRLKTGSFCCRFNNNTNLSWHFHVPALQVQMSCCTSLLICIEHVSPLQTSIYAA